MTDPSFDLLLTHLTYGGDALGKAPDGRAVFVPFGLPGERVRVKIIEEKRDHLRGELIEVLTPSEKRIQPLCPHFGHCGGCHYQHMAYPDQLEFKTQILREQLGRIGGLTSIPLEACCASEREWNYRNTLQFHLDAQGKLGFQASDSHTVIPIQECHLPEPALNALWPSLDFEPDAGLSRISLRVGVNDEALLMLEGAEPDAPALEVELPLSVVYSHAQKTSVLAGSEALWMQVKEKRYQVSANSFFQVNNAQAARMVELLLNELPLKPETTLLDVYCGVGLFSAFMAEKVGHLVGVELSESACNDFVINLDAFEHVDLYQGAAEAVLPGLELNPEVVVVDPPRAGLARPALQAILDKHPGTIAYVSCDPATLARDLKLFVGGGYHLEKVVPFDLFPQTYHMETVCLLRQA